MMIANIKGTGNLHGRYRITISDANSGILLKDSGWCNNLITNYGLNSIGNQQDLFQTCKLGSGSAAPTPSDVGVQIPLGSYASMASATYELVTDASGTYGKSVAKYNFSAGSIVGTIREVAVGDLGYSNTGAHSRSLLKVDGVPVELTATNTDLVSVEYELRNYITSLEENYQQVINGITYNVNSKFVGLTSSYYYGVRTSNSSRFSQQYYDVLNNGTYDFDGGALNTYVNNSYELTGTAIINNGIARTISRIDLIGSGNCVGMTQLTFTPNIQKSANQKIVFNYKYKWGRYEGTI